MGKFVIPTNISEIEAAQIYSDNWEDITELDYEDCQPNEINKLDFINGVKWEREKSYSEEDMIEFYQWCDTSDEAAIFLRKNRIDPDMSGNHFSKIKEKSKELLQIWKEQKIKNK